MAIFPVRPFAFAPDGSTFDRGPAHRVQCHDMAVDDPPLNHDRYAIVTIDPPVPDHQKEFWLAEVCRIITVDLDYELLDDFVYPLGIGCVVFSDMESRDAAIREAPHALTEDSTFNLVPHDEGLNMHMPAFEYEVWVMLLAFPMDYQTEHYVTKQYLTLVNFWFGLTPGKTRRGFLSNAISRMWPKSHTVF